METNTSDELVRPIRAATLQQTTVTVGVDLEKRIALAATRDGELPTVYWRQAAERAASLLEHVSQEEINRMADDFVRGTVRRDRLDGQTTKVSFRISGETAEKLDQVSELTRRTVSSLIREAAAELARELLPDHQVAAVHEEARRRFEQRIRIFQSTS